MTEIKMKEYFLKETKEYLIDSFKKANLSEEAVYKLFEWLCTPPRWTTIRVNTILCKDVQSAANSLQAFVDEDFENVNKCLEKMNEASLVSPKCNIISDQINECVAFDCSTRGSTNKSLNELGKKVLVDSKCAQAVCRGADIFIPGIIALSQYAKANDFISVYVDLKKKCLKGADPNNYILNNPEFVTFLANGKLLVDRDDIFKNSGSQKSGVGVKVTQLHKNVYIPSFEGLDESIFYPQNLPSIICAKVLDPHENELILDICAAPGGKTTHIAALVNNNARVIAFDKVPSRVKILQSLCEKLNASCVECKCQDATKIDLSIYKKESFDRILVDAPCSGLGQRPLVYSDMSVNQLSSYINYQRLILEKDLKKAVELLKPNGTMVYSTCTITIEENEKQVSWLLNKYKNLKLIDQSPYEFSTSNGLKCKGLEDGQLKLLQRFMPQFDENKVEEDESQTGSIYHDTNGFFIAKFVKE